MPTSPHQPSHDRHRHEQIARQEQDYQTASQDSPPGHEPDEFETPFAETNEQWWDVFLADDDECDPLPDPNDFWNDEYPNGE